MRFEQPTPPGIQLDALAPSTAPVQHDRGFLIVATDYIHAFDGAVTIPINQYGNPMSPVETATGVPLPIVTKLKGMSKNRHHAYFYDFLFNTVTPGSRAVRISRLQVTSEAAHKVFHKRFDGTELPKNEMDEYRLTVLNCAGYIPNFGVRIAGKYLAIGELNGQEKEALRRPKTFTSEKSADAQIAIGQFLMYSALSRQFDSSHRDDVEKFLSIEPKDAERNEMIHAEKLRLARRLTNIAISLAVAPIDQEFKDARTAQLLRRDSPPTAWQIVKDRLNGREAEYYQTLEFNLAQNYDLAA